MSRSKRNNRTLLIVIVVIGVLLASTAALFLIQTHGPVNIQFTAAPPVATGIADYGVLRSNGVTSAYKMEVRQILGEARINSISAYNSFHNSSVVTLSLNGVLKVNATSGPRVYWVENIAFFDTNDSYMNFNNEIWNQSSPGSVLTNSSASGTAGDIIAGASIASVSGYGQRYGLPFTFDFYTNASVVQDGVEIMMGYNIHGETPFGHGVYDTIRIKIPGATSAGFTVDGFSLDPIDQYYETELVYGGPPGGMSSTFTSMNSSLNLLYTTPSGIVIHPNAVWEFGRSAESAQNLQTSLVNGTPVVTLGKVNFSQDYQMG
jgi:thermopsin